MTKSIFVVLFLVSCCSLALAQVPLTMSYQGYLTDNAGTPVPDGTYSIVFSIYIVEVGGIPLWTETHPVVSVTKGLFNVTLGRGTPSNPLNIAFDTQYFLGIRVGVDPEMSPRVRMSSVAYSLNARTAEKLANTSVLTLGGDVTGPLTANSIAANAVTTPKIANDAVTTAKITDYALTTPKIADNAVTTAKILPDIVSSVDGVSNDGGNIDLVAGANITITPNNAANTITIAAIDSGYLTLPYDGTTNAATTAFDVENTGAGKAGYFHVTNAASTTSALEGNTNGNANSIGVEGRATNGIAVYARNNSNASPALYVRNDANGNGINAGADGPGNVVNIVKNSGSGRSINILNNGTGSAIYVEGNTSGVGLEMKQDGIGNAAYFHIDNTTTVANSLRATTASTNSSSDALEVVAAAGNGLDAINSSATEPTIRAHNNNASATAPIMILTNSTPTPAMRVNRSGDVTASGDFSGDTFIATTDNGAAGTPAIGGHYSDNVVYVWAHVVGTTGNLYGVGGTGGFGCTSTKTGTGTYSITYNRTMALGNFAPVATAWEASAPQFAVISAVSTTGCTVKIWKFSVGAFSLVDSDFFFILCGRP